MGSGPCCLMVVSCATLDHPYICHINEIAEAEGREFIVMEYVEGETLRSQITKEPLPFQQTLQVGIEVAEALEAAHARGIVHRDIKPENVMLTRTGHAKVMDFGLAKQVGFSAGADAPTLTLLTSEGSTVGTLAYMSPEQLRGQGADARSGDKDRVIQWLERAYEEHDNNMPYIGSGPIFDVARDDPRFKDLVRRVGLAR